MGSILILVNFLSFHSIMVRRGAVFACNRMIINVELGTLYCFVILAVGFKERMEHRREGFCHGFVFR